MCSIEQGLHMPEKVPKYLLTSSGYVLADFQEEGEEMIELKAKMKRPKYYAKGECIARRKLRKEQNLTRMISRFPELKLVSQQILDREQATARNLKMNPPIADIADSNISPKSKQTLLPINMFMQNPRKYNVLTFVDEQCWKTPSHYELYRNRDFDPAPVELQQAVLPKIERFPGVLPHYLDMGKGSYSKIRLYRQHKNATSESNPATHSEEDQQFWAKVDPRKDIKLLTTAYQVIKRIGCRDYSEKPQ